MSNLNNNPSHKDMMDKIKVNLAGLCKVIPLDKPVLYLGYPVHLNVGDSIIMKGAEAFFKDYGYNVIHRAGIHNFPSNFKVSEDATIVFHGGGNLCDLYYHWDQKWREKIVKLYPNNKIVLLPQSMDYKEGGNLHLAIEAFNGHKDMHICLRDNNSKAEADKHFNNTYLFPDMAQQLWGKLSSDVKPTKDTLFFIRKDDESTAVPSDLNLGNQERYDWDNLFTSNDRRIEKIIRRINRIEGITGIRLINHKPWYCFSNRFIQRSIDFFSGYNEVATNRLHASILGCLLGKKVKAFDNTSKKISAYRETWFKGSELFDIV